MAKIVTIADNKKYLAETFIKSIGKFFNIAYIVIFKTSNQIRPNVFKFDFWNKYLLIF